MPRPLQVDISGWEVLRSSEDLAVFGPSRRTKVELTGAGVVALGISATLSAFGFWGRGWAYAVHGLCWVVAYALLATPLVARLSVRRDRAAGVAHISARGPVGWGRRTLPLGQSRASFAYQPVWWRRRRTWRPTIGEQDELKGVRWLLKVVGPVPVALVLTVPKDGELPIDVKMMADQITRLIEAEYS